MRLQLWARAGHTPAPTSTFSRERFLHRSVQSVFREKVYIFEELTTKWLPEVCAGLKQGQETVGLYVGVAEVEVLQPYGGGGREGGLPRHAAPEHGGNHSGAGQPAVMSCNFNHF